MRTSAQSVFLETLNTCLNGAKVRFAIDGRELTAGPSNAQDEFRVRVHHHRVFRQILCFGNLGLGESFMRGDFEMETGRLCDFLTLLLQSRLDERIRKTARLAAAVAAIRVWNAVRTREANVQRHYDIGEDLFEAFLDSTLTYSCGYAESADDDLERLQQNKLDRICRKLRLAPGLELLDIGCGFGGLLMFAAQNYGVKGTGVTISHAHCERGNAEIRRRGLEGLVHLEFKEYRSIEGRYDRIVSVGMLEHVPASEYSTYFRRIAAALKPGGIGLVHTIGCNTRANQHDPFIQKYIFPESNQPRLSELAASMEHTGLAILDVENIIRHYSFTLLGWLERFQRNRASLDPNRYTQGFLRMWEYYLSCAVAAARASDAAVYQVLFHNDRAGEIPLKRV